jgi:hypothetical protein
MASPLVFLNVATSAQSQAYTPVWMGPGMTNGLNPVADVGCPAVNGARFLSPSPSSTPSTLSTPIYGPPTSRRTEAAEAAPTNDPPVPYHSLRPQTHVPVDWGPLGVCAGRLRGQEHTPCTDGSFPWTGRIEAHSAEPMDGSHEV